MARSTRLLGIGLHWDDFSVGDRFETVGRSITEADLTSFVGITGMQEVLFTNTEYLDGETEFEGQRLVPGALVFSFAEGLLIHAMLQRTGVAFMGMDFKVNGPTFVGDTIHVECEIVEARPTKNPKRGLVRTENKVINQKGESVITYTPARLIKGSERSQR